MIAIPAKVTSCALLAVFVLALISMADEVDFSKRMPPLLPLREALGKAEVFITEKAINLEEASLTRAQYHESGPWTEASQTEKTSGPYWQFTYEPNAWVNGGQTFVVIYMDGKARYIGGR